MQIIGKNIRPDHLPGQFVCPFGEWMKQKYFCSSFKDPEMFGPHKHIVHLDNLQRHEKTHRKTLGAASLYVNIVYIKEIVLSYVDCTEKSQFSKT